MGSGEDLAEVEDDESSTAAEKQLKIQLKAVEADLKEMTKRLSKESSDREKALNEKESLKEQVASLQVALEEEKEKSRSRRSAGRQEDDIDPTSLVGKKKALQAKAKALMSPGSLPKHS